MTSDDAPLAPHVPGRGHTVDGDHLVWFSYDLRSSMETVLAQAGIESGQVYRSWDEGFGAVLSAEQVDAVRRVPGVAMVERDTEGRPAPYPRTSVDRIEGSYIVEVVPGADPSAVAARLGIAPTCFYWHTLLGFAAEMTDAQLDRLRRDPDVEMVSEDGHVYLDPDH